MGITFKEFFFHEPTNIDDHKVANMYFYEKKPVREIAYLSNRSVREVYRIVRNYGEPNRCDNRSSTVISLADSGLPVKTIADITGYTPRHVRNILKKNV